MTRWRTFLSVLAALALLTEAVAVPVAAAAPATGAADGEVIVVDDDGGADYRSLAAAVANASDGDTVRVRPGTYRGGIELAANVTVVAPRGATVAGPGLDANESATDTAFRVVSGSHAAPVISGFTVTGFFDGVSAWNTTGDWVVRDTTFRYPIGNGVMAMSSRGDWRVENVTVLNASDAVVTIDAEGDWTVEDSVLRGAEQAIEAPSATGDWALRNVTIANDAGVEADDDEVTLIGVAARNTSGDWAIENSTVRNAVVGVSAYRTSGNWTVANTTVRNISESERYEFMMPPLTEGVGVFAGEATGAWTVRDSTFVGVTAAGIDATGASPGGTAVDNEFGPPLEDMPCAGNVRCGGGRTGTGTTPTATPTPGAGSTPTATDRPPTPTATDDSSTPTPTVEPQTPTPIPTDDGITPPTGDRTGTAGDGPLPAWVGLLAVVSLGVLLARRTG